MKETPKDGAPAPKDDPEVPDVGGGYVSDPPGGGDIAGPGWPMPTVPDFPQFPGHDPFGPVTDPPVNV